MALGKRVEQARKLRGMTQQQLAEVAGMPPGSGQATIHALETRDSGRTQYAWALAKALQVRLEWLLTGDGEMDEPPGHALPDTDGDDPPYARGGGSLIQPAAVWDDDTPVDDDEVEVPFYKEVEFAAGSGAMHGLEINGRRVRYGRSSLRAAGVDPHNAACGKATGNSMEPLIQDGSLVGIDRGKTQIVDGEIYALDHDGMLRVKYVYRLPGGGLRLRSFNHEEHPDETYSGEEAQRIKILGWVWTWSPPIRKWRGR